MGEDLSPGNADRPLAGMDTESSRPRDSKSRELLSSLFGQVAASAVRNIIDDGVATLEKLDKMLAERVAQFTERRKQLKSMENEDERQHVLQLLEQQQTKGADCSMQLEEHNKEDTSYKLHYEELKHLKDD